MADFLRYAGKRVLVTGCFSGMGEATAHLLLEQGAEVHGFDYRDSAVPLASFTKVDLRDQAAVKAAVATLGGRVDALFNCAGLPHTFPAADVMKVNFIGARYLTEQVLPLMDDGGAIASLASIAGARWNDRLQTILELLATGSFAEAVAWYAEREAQMGGAYGFSKEALIVWTMVQSQSLIKRGIRINCLLPGPTETPMMTDHFAKASPDSVDWSTQPIGRRSSAREQAEALVFLNSAAASFINGVALPADGGFTAGRLAGMIGMRGARP